MAFVLNMKLSNERYVSLDRRVNCGDWKKVQRSFQSVSSNVDAAIQACHNSQTPSPSAVYQQVDKVLVDW